MTRLSLQLLPVLIQPVGGATIGIRFSPDGADTAIVLQEDRPSVHDLRRAGVPDNILLARQKRELIPVVLDDDTSIGTRPMTSRATDAAYRPGTADAAIVFGQDDYFIHRFEPRTGKLLEPLAFDESTSVVYSACGRFLAAGNAKGLVELFRLPQGQGEVERICRQEVGGPVRTICIVPAAGVVRVATDFNSLVEFAIEGENDTAVQQGQDVYGESMVVRQKVHAIACNTDGLTAWAGIGNDVWLLDPKMPTGVLARPRAFSRVSDLKFSARGSELFIVGDAGADVLHFKRGTDGQPVLDTKLDHWNLLRPDIRMVGVQDYNGAVLCIGFALPPRSGS